VSTLLCQPFQSLKVINTSSKNLPSMVRIGSLSISRRKMRLVVGIRRSDGDMGFDRDGLACGIGVVAMGSETTQGLAAVQRFERRTVSTTTSWLGVGAD
jgi:hypothetical protein